MRRTFLIPAVFLCFQLVGTSACKQAVPAPAPVVVQADAATPTDELLYRSRQCMGTKCEIKLFTGNAQLAERAFAAGFDEMARIEGLMTTWRDSSEVSQINLAAGKAPVHVSSDTFTVVQRGLQLSEISNGAFDITVGTFSGLWKFDEDNDGTLPKPAEVKKRLALVGYKEVVIDEKEHTVFLKRAGMKLTLGGIAKGYAVDAAVAAIRKTGLANFIVQAGGDLFAAGRHGDRDWRVGIRDPRGVREAIIFKLELSNGAFNTSGDYERFIIKDGKRYHHILDARTGFPSMLARSVTVLAPTAFDADLLDTTLFVMGAKKAMAYVEKHPELQAVVVDAGNRVFVSSGLQGRLQKVHDPSSGI